jgi:hypothetical protein
MQLSGKETALRLRNLLLDLVLGPAHSDCVTGELGIPENC